MAIKRILEPEVMETETDAVEYDGMDFTDVNLAFAQRAVELAPAAGLVLDIGTGTARIPILMLQHTAKNLTVRGVDLSREMLKVAQKNVEAAGLTGKIVLQRVDAKTLPFAQEEFDMVVSNSLAHHLGDPGLFFDEVARVVRAHGSVFLRDLIRPETPKDLYDLVEKYAGDATEHQRKLYHDSLCAALTIPEVEQYVQKSGLAGARVVQSSDRHWSVEKSP
jgi:ubiquinone/menaquinone biosynthesis C-methylase UbiE